jgi:uncharacterized protein YjiS (DUF1127 family)
MHYSAKAGSSERAYPASSRAVIRDRLRRCIDTIQLWRTRSRSRRELHRALACDPIGAFVPHDIGVSRLEAEREACKWFWQP